MSTITTILKFEYLAYSVFLTWFAYEFNVIIIFSDFEFILFNIILHFLYGVWMSQTETNYVNTWYVLRYVTYM